MADPYDTMKAGLSSPIENIAAITPHDTNDLDNATRAIWVGGAGDLKVITTGGTEDTLYGVPAGTLVQVRVRRVKATGTTATLLTAMW